MTRRRFLKGIAAAGLMPAGVVRMAEAADPPEGQAFRRVRPGDAGWPSEAKWNSLSEAVGGRLVKLASPLDVCGADPAGEACKALLSEMRNPYFISDNPALTQTSGWLDAWTSTPSAYAVAVQTTDHVVAAVNFARENNLRLVVKGGGHSYQGTSDSADSLLIWTREMSGITMHDAFVPRGCDATHAPQPAVTVETGARWYSVYQAVTTRGLRYVQGGGCTTVGVAGFINGGGFGSLSKHYGLGAAALLEAEIVTADGAVLVVNACNHPELFWGIKGGGGGGFGVLTKLTLRTRELPTTIGGVSGVVQATSDAAFRRLIAKVVDHYADNLFNPHWGEQLAFGNDNSLKISLVFQGLERDEAEAIWKPFADAIAAAPQDFGFATPLNVGAGPARFWWDPVYFQKNLPGVMSADDRPGAPSDNLYNAGDGHEVGQFIHAYRSVWMPASLLQPGGRQGLADAIFAATRHKNFAFHFNKGLAGASPEEVEAARDTAMNPAVLDAFALAIIANVGPLGFPGVPGLEPDVAAARAGAELVRLGYGELVKVAPGKGAYLAESDFFQEDWKRAFWGSNFDRLAAVKARYDPDGLFFTHQGVGSDEWSDDGFTRLPRP